MRVNRKKIFLSLVFNVTGISYIFSLLQRFLFGSDVIRAVNYHSIPFETKEIFRKHLIYFSKYYTSVKEHDLEMFFKTGKWHKKKPGLILSFDDGIKDNFDIAYPLLEEYGFTGWFFVPTDFVNTAVNEQLDFAKNNQITVKMDLKMDRVALNWDEINILAKNHVVGSHTRSHYRMEETADNEKLKYEIVQSKNILEEKIGKEVVSFCWVGGEEHTYTKKAFQLIEASDYKFGFMTNTSLIFKNTSPFLLDRTNLNSHWPLYLIRFQLCGIMDLLYRKKRKRVHKYLVS